MRKKALIVISVVVIFGLAGGFWKWKSAKDAQVSQNNQEQRSNEIIDTSNWKTYKNDQYGFEINLPEEMNNNYKVYSSPVLFEVGQKDKCNDCALIQFVVPTKNQNLCAFPGDCGKVIAFVIWVRDIASWENNHLNKNYACISEANIVKKTDKYVYTLCPFNIDENEKKYTPEDVLPLLNKALPWIKSNFIIL